MVSVHVFAPALSKYLVEEFGMYCQGNLDDALFFVPTHFLTILPEDGWESTWCC